MNGRKLIGLALTGLLASAGSAAADEAWIPIPNVYLTPTLGVWHWDRSGVQGLDLRHRTAPVYGGRAGFSPIDAFGGELVFLTGTNEVKDGDRWVSVRLTQIEASFVVNFRSLVDARVYPFLDLGGGASVRRGGALTSGSAGLDRTHIAFHLGGGLKADLSSHLSLRGNLRDTFFTESQGDPSNSNQVTVDSVELSGGLEYRIGLGNTFRGPKRLR